MKSKLFRRNASVIPTGAPTLRSGQAAWSGGIPSFRRFLATLGMMVLFCWPATAQGNGVTVSNFVVEAGAPTTVTFNVSWNRNSMPDVWSDTVWVFVDYLKAGRMERMPLEKGATLTNNSAPGVGKVVEVSGNNTGVWVVGNAKTADAGSFSATVQLLTATADLHGACAYASNYPPVAEYVDATHLSIKGVPLYKMVIAAGANTYTAYSDGSYTLSRGHTLQSFTDKTGAPGTMTCKTPDIYELKSSAAAFCAGSSVTFALSGTEAGKTYRLFRGSNTAGTLSTASGGAATFTGAFAGAGAYTAQVDAEGEYCPAAMSGTRVVVENPLPALTVNGNSRHCPGTVTLTASSSPGATINWYVAIDAASSVHTGTSYTTPEIDESTTYYAQARMTSTGCLSERKPVVAEVIMENCCHAPGASGVTFAAFNPCTATFGATWTLTDDRDNNTYKVKYMPDGRYWMVQDLKFGDRCAAKTSTTTSSASGLINSSGSYYGDCSNAVVTGGGFMYTQYAIMNATTNSPCTGTAAGTVSPAPSACRGVCPAGWHPLTHGELVALNTNKSGLTECTTTLYTWPACVNMSGSHCSGCSAVSVISSEGELGYSSSAVNLWPVVAGRGYVLRCLRNY